MKSTRFIGHGTSSNKQGNKQKGHALRGLFVCADDAGYGVTGSSAGGNICCSKAINPSSCDVALGLALA